MQPIRVSITETEQPIRSREIFARNQRENSCWTEPSRDIKKRGLKQRIKNGHNGYRDLEIGINGIQYTSFQLKKCLLYSTKKLAF